MARTKISEFSATAGSNTDIDSINLAEGCAPSGINDAIRELMSQLKDFQTGAVGDSFNGPVGSTTAGTGAFTTLAASSTTTLSGLTASTALALDASKNVVSVTNTGTGSNVLATSPTFVTPVLGTPASGTVTNLTGTASININGTVGATTATTGAFTTLSASGNVALNVTPSSWISNSTGTLQLAAGSLYKYDTTIFGMVQNSYLDSGGTWRYITTASTAASAYYQSGGTHIFRTAAAGLGGDPVSFSNVATITSTGLAVTGALSATKAGSIGTLTENTAGTGAAYYQAKNTAGSTIFGNDATGGYLLTDTNVPLLFYINNTERARIDSSGNLGVGTTSPTKRLQVESGSTATGGQAWSHSSGTVYARIGVVSPGVTSNDTEFGTVSNNDLRFITFNTERARIDSSGNFVLGDTTAYAKATIVANASGGPLISFRDINGSATNYDVAVFNRNGTQVGSISTTNIATLYNTTSDQRLKQNIVDAPDFGRVIDSIQVRSFDWKTSGTHQRAGFIAQELVTVAPEAVHQPTDTEEMMAVDYSKLVPMLVKEIQDLRKRLAAAGI